VRNKALLHDLILLAVGACLGYFYAIYGRRLGLGLPEIPVASGWVARAQAYQRAHPTEVLVGAVLLGVILYLAFGRGKGGPSTRKR
jgi:hypothetical protein